MEPVELRTARLVLNQPVESDIDAITSYCQDPLFERYLTVPWPYLREHAAGFVNELVPAWWASGAEMTVVGVIEAAITYGLGVAFAGHR